MHNYKLSKFFITNTVNLFLSNYGCVMNQNISNNKSIIWIAGFGLLTIILWNVPFGNLILYPFTILGTWFHEMGHGLTAEILGGNFHRLVLLSDGSGYAQFSYDTLFLANFGKAIVAAGGPLGPTIAGSIFLISSTNIKITRIILIIFTLILIVSLLIWVRPIFSLGFLITAIFAAVFSFIVLKGKDSVKRGTLQFIGVQAIASLYQSIGYLYSSGGVIEGQQFKSDTQVIADNIWLPNWFAASLILLVSVFAIYFSLKHVIKSSKTVAPNGINQY